MPVTPASVLGGECEGRLRYQRGKARWEKEGNKKEAKKEKKPKWKRPIYFHVASPAKSGLTVSNAKLGIKTGTPTTTAPTATSVSTPAIKTSPPKPAMVSTEPITRERRVGAGRF
jgi:hypothetical protein